MSFTARSATSLNTLKTVLGSASTRAKSRTSWGCWSRPDKWRRGGSWDMLPREVKLAHHPRENFWTLTRMVPVAPPGDPPVPGLSAVTQSWTALTSPETCPVTHLPGPVSSSAWWGCRCNPLHSIAIRIRGWRQNNMSMENARRVSPATTKAQHQVLLRNRRGLTCFPVLFYFSRKPNENQISFAPISY